MRPSTLRSLYAAAGVVASLVLVPGLHAQTAVVQVTGGTVTEGDAGTSTVTFHIVCDPCASVNAIVDWSTMDGSATTADNDYVAKSGQIDDLGNGSAPESYPISVTVNGDTAVEADETFFLKITNASVGCPSLGGPGGCPTSPTAAVATATIVNDDTEASEQPEQPPSSDGLPCGLLLLILLLLLLLFLLTWWLRKKRG